MVEIEFEQVRKELKKVQGQIVFFLLYFMENESSIILIMGMEMFLFVDVWI